MRLQEMLKTVLLIALAWYAIAAHAAQRATVEQLERILVEQ